MQAEAAVHVIDDDEAMRDSLAFLLDSAGVAAVVHASAEAFLAGGGPAAAAVVITDVRMPGMSGVELLRRMKAAGGGPPVIVVTGHGDVPLAVEAMRLGAADFLEKPFSDDVLLAAVRQALARRREAAEAGAAVAAIRDRLAALSQREREVLDGLVAGKANKAIAFDLGISPRTVEIYRAHVMTKMGAASLSDLVRMSLQAGEDG